MTRLKKIVTALPALVIFLMASAVLLEAACVYGLVHSVLMGATADVSIYLLIIIVLGAMLAIGLMVGNHLAKSKE
ncbi:hypothetical protein [Tunicatimonas pelagia]|uniref:hypothetical protein n=1 Tax=Tunicatimonas pelagia TaxID=931531 RepID=UPI0026671982|nr:hypothetical protein [Tunicatimonas pelagia]WKN41894.1 hypothetical protein P0M28_22905 [Tunicatimonas pelagia]